MSEYLVCDTEFADVTALREALVDIGVEAGHIEVHDSPVALEGYQGDRRSQRAHVVIRRRHVGGASNDIGFEKTEDGRYKAWVSEYDRGRGIGKKIMTGALKQQYAKRQIMSYAKGRIKMKSCEQKDGKIRIRLGLS